MDKSTLIKVANRSGGRVGYQIPELNVRRQFTDNEVKDIEFGELLALSYLPGGDVMLSQYLVIDNQEAVKELLHKVEPEYFYTKEDIVKLMSTGSLDEFLDMLDFAPTGVIDLVKEVAVSLPLNDVAKREAIMKKTGFDVTKAIEIQNTKYDGDTDAATAEAETKPTRRAQAAEPEKPARRASAPKYKVIEK